MTHSTEERITPCGIVLFNLGGPDSLETIEPFLYNLFMDPDIIDFPLASIARKPLARFISSRRAKRVSAHYAEIGGRSPILELTTQQAKALEAELNKTIDVKVFIAMRYWHPMTQEVAAQIQKGKFDRLVLLPLYPQYSNTTTGSSLNEWNRCYKDDGKIDVRIVRHFYDHSLYIEAIVENIISTMKRFENVSAEDVHLVFSAHGIPLYEVRRKGDPYERQIHETVRLVMTQGKFTSPHYICYQSKVGPFEWLKPSLPQTVHELAEKGEKHLLVIPISFVTEQVETLYEIDIETRREAEQLGISQFEMMPALNDSPKFIQALADIVMKELGQSRFEM